jgi:hypothetical protein
MPRFAWPYWLAAGTAALAATASACTAFVPGVLRGTAVMNGSGRGTALVVLFAAVPLLVISAALVGAGSVRPVITWLGADAYILYNSVLFLFITPFNQLFLLYVAMFCLSFWTLVTVVKAIDVPAFARRFSIEFPARSLAVVLAVVGGLNGLAWLANVVPGVLSTTSPKFLVGTGLTTNPIYAQDLSFWVPLMLVSAVWLWQRRPWGFVNAGALLVFGAIESISIAVDQWMGATADPSSTVASASFAPIFAVVAAVTLIPLFFYFRNLARR